jgi:hypothetical protein
MELSLSHILFVFVFGNAVKPKKISKKIRKWLEKAEYNIQEDFYKDWKVY